MTLDTSAINEQFNSLSISGAIKTARKIKSKRIRLATYLKANFGSYTGMGDTDWLETADDILAVVR